MTTKRKGSGWGGARPGAGRKPKVRPTPVKVAGTDILKMLQDVALGLIDTTPIQVQAAIAALKYTHTNRADGGKKSARIDCHSSPRHLPE
jgi:phage terminase small subunit